MVDWTEGYVAEIPYTFGYYDELNPLRLAVPLVNVGLAPPAIATACELGFGQGITVNIHAAASAVRWYGTDFNPAHAAFAQSLAAASGSDAQLFDQSFDEFCCRSDLPDFDFIALHGIWSWVSEHSQLVIVDFIRRKLKAGGVLYVSYNTQPGNAATVSLQHLLVEHAEVMAAPGSGILARVDGALEFAEKVLQLNPGFAIANPSIAERLKVIKAFDRHYVAHEYLNRQWRALLFAEMARSLAPAKLSYACSARYLDHIDTLNLTADQQRFLMAIPDPMFRQSVRDFIVNQQFRRDYWVKGAQRLSPLELRETLSRLKLVLISPRSDVAVTVQGALGQSELVRAIYDPIIEVLGDHQPKTIGEIVAALTGSDLQPSSVYEAVMILAGNGDLAPVQPDDVQKTARPRTDRFNLRMLDKARGGGELPHLASPVTGGAIGAARFHQLFLLALRQRRKTPDELARFAWEILGSQGQRLARDGKPLDTADDNLAELAAQAREFTLKRLPILRALQAA